MSKPEDIRRTIASYREELERFGVIAFSAITSGPKGGATGTAYYLNDDQATYVAMHSAATPGLPSQAQNPHPLLNGQSCGNTKTPALKRTNIVIRS